MLTVFRKLDCRRKLAQDLGQCDRRHRPAPLPVGCRDCHHHAVVGLADLQRQISAGHVLVTLLLPMHTASRGFDDRDRVVRDQRQAQRT